MKPAFHGETFLSLTTQQQQQQHNITAVAAVSVSNKLLTGVEGARSDVVYQEELRRKEQN